MFANSFPLLLKNSLIIFIFVLLKQIYKVVVWGLKIVRVTFFFAIRSGLLTHFLPLVTFCTTRKHEKTTLREKCPYSESFWSVFSRIRTEYGKTLRISPYSVRMRKNTDQNNSKYGHFLRSARCFVIISRTIEKGQWHEIN